MVAKAVAVQGNVATPAGAQGVIDAAVKQFGRLDVLVNNSGVYEFAPIEEINPDHFHRQFDVNVLGLLLTTQAAAKHLDAGASIINVGSAITSLTPPNSAVYSATKGAVDAITGVLAKEFGGGCGSGVLDGGCASDLRRPSAIPRPAPLTPA